MRKRKNKILHAFFNAIHNHFHILKFTYFIGLLFVSGLLTILPIMKATAKISLPSSKLAEQKTRDNSPIEYFHVLSTGQSLSLGVYSSPTLTIAQPYNNLMMQNGADQINTPLVPLTELGSAKEWQNTESPSSGLGNTLRSLDNLARSIIVSLHGRGATNYLGLKKGTQNYTKGITQATNAKNYVQNILGGLYRPLAVTAIHGETDYLDGTTNNGQSWAAYANALQQWQSDYQIDLSTLVGSNLTIPLFINQMNSAWTGEIAVAQLQAHKSNPGKVILVGPKYQMTYHTDHLHLTNQDSKYMGELMGKVINKVAVQGQTWNPLMPTSVIRTGNIITISYAIPVGQLAIDTTRVAARQNYGFTFAQSGGNGSNVSISSVQLASNNTKVKITLNQVPTGASQKIRYAWGCGNYTWFCGGAATWWYAGGNIRDSDNSVSQAPGSTNLPLYNWSVAFDEPVTMISPVITNFSTPIKHSSLTVPILAFSAIDDVAVTGYLLTESPTVPSLNNPLWSASAPSSYTFTSFGNKTLYAWAKDSDGNISTSISRSIRILNPSTPAGL